MAWVTPYPESCPWNTIKNLVHLFSSLWGQAVTPNPSSSFQLWVSCHPEPFKQTRAALQPGPAQLWCLLEPQMCDPGSPPPGPTGKRAGNCRYQLNWTQCFSSACCHTPRSCRGDVGGWYVPLLPLLAVQDGQGVSGVPGKGTVVPWWQHLPVIGTV